MTIASIIRICPAAVLLAIAGPSEGRAEPLSVEGAAAAYVTREGFERTDPGRLDADMARLLGESDSMVGKDVDISPIERALLLVDLEEKPLSRLRYVLRYGQQTIDDVDVSFIDVARYNLGPVLRLDAIEAYGAENVAGAKVFGVGPHVEWRFVTQPTAKLAALVLSASRREISNGEAAARNCLPRTCLSLDTFDDLAEWTEPQPLAEMPQTAYPATTSSGVGDEITQEIAPAAQALELAIAAKIAAPKDGGFLWTIPGRAAPPSPDPYVVVVIDRNLGQETMSDAVLGIAKLDKDRDQRWVRLSAGVFDALPVQSIFRATGSLTKR